MNNAKSIRLAPYFIRKNIYTGAVYQENEIVHRDVRYEFIGAELRVYTQCNVFKYNMNNWVWRIE
jgi:hypothetical protein